MWLLVLEGDFCHTLCGVLSPLSAVLGGGGGMAPCIQGVEVCWLVVCVWKWDCSEGCATENECGSRWCLW